MLKKVHDNLHGISSPTSNVLALGLLACLVQVGSCLPSQGSLLVLAELCKSGTNRYSQAHVRHKHVAPTALRA